MARGRLDEGLSGAGPRFLAAGASLRAGETVPLPPEERRHARSRRLPDGARVVLLDGKGASAEGTLTDGGTAIWIERVASGMGEPDVAITVLLAAAEPARVEWAVEKGTECGAAAFVLLAAARSQAAHLAASRARMDRLRRIAAEAVKQSGRTVVPDVSGPAPLGEALVRAPRPLLVARHGAPPLDAESALGKARRASLAVGPEGGFSKVELDTLEAAGARFVGLGPRILRLETAVAAALARLVDVPRK